MSLECRLLTRLRLPSDHPAVENNVVIDQVVGFNQRSLDSRLRGNDG